MLRKSTDSQEEAVYSGSGGVIDLLQNFLIHLVCMEDVWIGKFYRKRQGLCDMAHGPACTMEDFPNNGANSIFSAVWLPIRQQ